jgi:hypothetical protein
MGSRSAAIRMIRRVSLQLTSSSTAASGWKAASAASSPATGSPEIQRAA